MNPDEVTETKEKAQADLMHFLNLAAAQIKSKSKVIEQSGERYSERVNRLRVLEELIKEQAPQHGK